MKNNYYWLKLGHLEDIRKILYAIHNDKKNLDYNFQSMTNCALVNDKTEIKDQAMTKVLQNIKLAYKNIGSTMTGSCKTLSWPIKTYDPQ